MGRCVYVGKRNLYIYRARHGGNPSVAFGNPAKRHCFRCPGKPPARGGLGEYFPVAPLHRDIWLFWARRFS